MRKNKISHYQEIVLNALAGKIDDFYLAGGTALSLFYFQHRMSIDLDFFTKDFEYLRVKKLTEYLGETLQKKVKIIAQSLEEDKAKIVVCNIYFTPKDILKIDFVEDFLGLIKKPRMVDGVRILSLEDIYLRKIYAIAGVVKTFDDAGRERFLGSRMDAKDFYDIYFLSHTFMPLSKFVDRYCNALVKEGLIRWFRIYDRMGMIDGILSLNIAVEVDYKNIERQLKKEIDKIIERQSGEI